MSLTLRAMSLVFLFSVFAQAENRTLALYMAPPRGLDNESLDVMRAEVQRLLAPAGLDIVWKTPGERKAGEDYELVAVASFDGSCSAPEAAPAPSTVSLADTAISDGRILPFFHVDCPRILQLLGAQVESPLLGRALGRVIAHELYHIVARTAEHHDNGVAKAVFSIRDLKNPQFEFDAWSLDQMRPPSIASSEELRTDAAGR
jgi:hypothetical protein